MSDWGLGLGTGDFEGVERDTDRAAIGLATLARLAGALGLLLDLDPTDPRVAMVDDAWLFLTRGDVGSLHKPIHALAEERWDFAEMPHLGSDVGLLAHHLAEFVGGRQLTDLHLVCDHAVRSMEEFAEHVHFPPGFLSPNVTAVEFRVSKFSESGG